MRIVSLCALAALGFCLGCGSGVAVAPPDARPEPRPEPKTSDTTLVRADDPPSSKFVEPMRLFPAVTSPEMPVLPLAQVTAPLARPVTPLSQNGLVTT